MGVFVSEYVCVYTGEMKEAWKKEEVEQDDDDRILGAWGRGAGGVLESLKWSMRGIPLQEPSSYLKLDPSSLVVAITWFYNQVESERSVIIFILNRVFCLAIVML